MSMRGTPIYFPCPKCNGEGIDLFSDEAEDCDFCAGTGVVSKAELDDYRAEELRMRREGPIL